MRVGNLIRHRGTALDRIIYLVIGSPECPFDNDNIQNNSWIHGHGHRNQETSLTIYSFHSGKRGTINLYDLDCWEIVA